MSMQKLAAIGLAASLVVQIVGIVVEIRDHRKGKRRLNRVDIDTIADAVADRMGAAFNRERSGKMEDE